jgi:hydrogenase expression/formation protein HypC
MCLALPARIEQRDDILAWVVIGEARMRISLIMTPEANVGDWVLVHAGYAIRTVAEQDAIETWKIIESVESAPVDTTTAPRGIQEVSP